MKIDLEVLTAAKRLVHRAVTLLPRLDDLEPESAEARAMESLLRALVLLQMAEERGSRGGS